MKKVANFLMVLIAFCVISGCKNNGGDMTFKEEKLNLSKDWDKTFPKSDKVEHKKVQFHNRFGITLAGDLYAPKNTTGKMPAIAVCGPYGAVKEQASGLYAQTMAERGFVTMAVDFLSLQENVDENKIGIIGICGWGGYARNASWLSRAKPQFQRRLERDKLSFTFERPHFALCGRNRKCHSFDSRRQSAFLLLFARCIQRVERRQQKAAHHSWRSSYRFV